MNFRIVLLLGLMILSGCSFKDGEGQKDRNRALLEQNEKAKADIQPILGRWAGTLMRGTEAIPIELYIDIKPNQDGRTTEGGNIIRFDPRATLRSTTDSRYTYDFAGSFYKETGDLLLTNETAVRADDFVGLTLMFNNDAGTITGTVRAKTYVVGTLSLTRQANQEAGGNPIDEEERTYQQDRVKFTPLTGEWVGKVSVPGGNPAQYQVFLSVVLIEAPVLETGRLRPQLQATYTRSDIGSDIIRNTLAVTYNYRNSPPTILFTQDNPTNNNRMYIPKIVGRFVPNADGTPNLTRITGSHLSVNQGITGTIDLVKKSSVVEDPKPPAPTPTPTPKPPAKPPRRR